MPKQVDREKMLRHAATGMYAGIQFIVTFLVFVAVGYFADRKMGTAPGFLANGAVVGFLLALWRLNRQGRRIMADGETKSSEEAEDADKDQGEAPGPEAEEKDGPDSAP